MHMQTAVRPDQPQKFLVCDTCGKLLELSAEHLRKYTIHWRWPTCCGHTMAVRVDDAASKDTVVD